ncbi:hypothetical protein V6N13_138518 [Hibiscus sabdariffa]|uniref:GATA-type domain-containing protein n=1 Tax=Hibiscus sabdariffa TaxID=183260 RepID=A0ABR2AFX0_9ROSI
MINSWFDKGCNGVGVNDDFFDDVIKYLDLPFEDVEGADCHGNREENTDGGEEWDCNFENLEPPPTNVLAGLSSGFYGDFFSDGLDKSLAISYVLPELGYLADAVRTWHITCAVVHHMLLHCNTAVWSKQAGRTNQCLFCLANKWMGPPDNAVGCDMIDVQYQSGTIFLINFCNGSSQLNQQSSNTKASSGTRGSITLHTESTDVKVSTWFQTSSPVSVLESSSSCSGANSASINPKLSFPVKRGRSKSKRRPASTFNLHFTLPSISSTSLASRVSDYQVGSESESESHLTEKRAKKRQNKKKNLTLLSSSSEIKKPSSQQSIVVMKCMHCEITETPQWREGPMGPKTLCNACGVRYRSGRLFPEYRPAASPTFIPSLHSNSHKKVVEMRKKAKLPLSNPPKCRPNSSRCIEQY